MKYTNPIDKRRENGKCMLRSVTNVPCLRFRPAAYRLSREVLEEGKSKAEIDAKMKPRRNKWNTRAYRSMRVERIVNWNGENEAEMFEDTSRGAPPEETCMKKVAQQYFNDQHNIRCRYPKMPLLVL